MMEGLKGVLSPVRAWCLLTNDEDDKDEVQPVLTRCVPVIKKNDGLKVLFSMLPLCWINESSLHRPINKRRLNG
jgi:hypothetical protein